MDTIPSNDKKLPEFFVPSVLTRWNVRGTFIMKIYALNQNDSRAFLKFQVESCSPLSGNVLRKIY
jgi:hypothetical protein